MNTKTPKGLKYILKEIHTHTHTPLSLSVCYMKLTHVQRKTEITAHH